MYLSVRVWMIQGTLYPMLQYSNGIYIAPILCKP